MARIESVNYEQKDTSRSANLKTQSSSCTRPLVKIVFVLLSSSFGREDITDFVVFNQFSRNGGLSTLTLLLHMALVAKYSS